MSGYEPQVPPEPGSTPIPPGHVRLWHYTGGDPEEIRQQGLLMDHAKGESYGEPNQIWASGRPPSFQTHRVVEFHIPRDDPRWSIGKYQPWVNYEHPEGDSRTDPDYDYGKRLYDRNAHVTFFGDIRPDEVLAVHEPWHTHYRYLMENYPTPDSSELAQMGGPSAFDWALDPRKGGDPELARAIQEWKATLWPEQPGTTAKTASPLYYRWAFSPTTGRVELSTNSEAHPLDVAYHSDLARRLNEPDLVHGYAYRIGGGWRLTDWDSKPLDDQYVIAQVMRALTGQEASRAPGPDSHTFDLHPREAGLQSGWDRCHHGLPT